MNLQSDPTIEYGYLTTPQTGVDGQVLTFPRAKMTGGCGAHNGMIYELGNKFDYDLWQASGNPGWSWDDIHPIWNEIDGQIDEDILAPSKFYPQMLATLQEDGYRYNTNPNSGVNTGASLHRFMANKVNDTYARRLTAYEIFVDRYLPYRDNMDVLVFTRADKILFDSNKKAYGILATNIGTNKKYIFTARNEVILSGGVIETPKLLMLSGVGPSAHLKSKNITVVKNLPGVGQHLQDHLFLPVFGPPLKNQSTEIPEPIYSDSGYVVFGPDNGKPNGSLPRMYSSLFVSANYYDGRLGFGGWVEALRMNSTGTVTLASSNPADLPVINPNYLSVASDVDEIIFGIRQLRRWLNNTHLTQYTEPIQHEIFPGWQYQTRAELEAVIRANVVSDFHPSGTCKMGPDSDPSAVVDNRLRVKGVSNLRVLDSSIFPERVSGNPNQPTMIVGLKGARMIIEDCNRK